MKGAWYTALLVVALLLVIAVLWGSFTPLIHMRLWPAYGPDYPPIIQYKP